MSFRSPHGGGRRRQHGGSPGPHRPAQEFSSSFLRSNLATATATVSPTSKSSSSRGSDPLLADTDGDSFEDGDEVLVLLTDPLVPNVGGGTIRGTVFSDPDGDGDLTDGLPVANAKVYLDTNFNGVLDSGERSLTTGADGSYEFILLSPGYYHVRQELPAATVQTAARTGLECRTRHLAGHPDRLHPRSRGGAPRPIRVWSRRCLACPAIHHCRPDSRNGGPKPGAQAHRRPPRGPPHRHLQTPPRSSPFPRMAASRSASMRSSWTVPVRTSPSSGPSRAWEAEPIDILVGPR